MPNYACPMPDPNAREPEALRELLKAKRIAVVGASDDPMRPAHYVPQFMIQQGCEIVPVNPKYERVFGVTSYASLEEVPDRVDLVNVFRRPGFCPAVVEAAIRMKAGGVWLQSGIVSEEAKRIAQEAGLPFVQDRCLMVEYSMRK